MASLCRISNHCFHYQTFESGSKRGALVDLGRHFGMFKGKQEGDLSVGVHAMDDEALEAYIKWECQDV